MLHFWSLRALCPFLSLPVLPGPFPSVALLCVALPVHFLSVMEGGLSPPATQVPRTPILQHRPAPLGPAYPPARRSLRGRAAAMKFAPGAKKCYSRPYRTAHTAHTARYGYDGMGSVGSMVWLVWLVQVSRMLRYGRYG